MKKKRLSMFSLLIALTLTLGACDDLEDLFPSGSDSDESTELTEDEDPSSGVNPNEDENENDDENDDDNNDDENPNDDDEKGNEPVITYSLSITNKDSLLSLAYDEDNPTTTDYTLAVSLLTYTDGELTATSQLSSSDVTVTSSNEEVATANGLTLTLGSVSGSSEIVAAWKSDSCVIDSFTLSYTYTAHVEKIDYEYNLSITNKTELLGTDSIWLIDSGVHTFQLALTKTEIIDGVEGTPEDVTGFTASLSQTNLGESVEEIVTIYGLSVTPAALGSVRITATFTDGDYSASDYIDVMINESYYEGDYSLKINNVTDFTGTDEGGDGEDVWRVGDAINLDVTLSYKWYAYSTGLAASEEQTLVGTYSNLSVLVYNSTGDCVTGEDLTNDIYFYQAEDDSLTLVPLESAANNTYTIVVYWTGHTEAYETFTVTIGEKLGNSYSLEITSNEIPTPWYYEDKDSYSVSFKITETNKETEQTSEVTLSEIANELTIRSTNEEVATATLDSDYSIKITAVGAGSASIYIIWSTHTEAIGHVELNIAQHSYELVINTPDEGLGTQETPWRVEEGTRSISLSATMDGAEATPTYVEVKSSDESVVTVSGSSNSYTLTPVADGNTTIVASWYKESGDETPLATAQVPVYISDEIVAVSVSLTQTSISFTAPNETETITASVLGANDTTATNQNVMWSVTGSGVTISDTGTDYVLGSNEVTVMATEYSSTATVTATSQDGGHTASCEVTVGDRQPVAATPLPLTTGSLNNTIIGTPSDRGVYVIGNPSTDTYLASSGTASSYEDAEAVRTVATEEEGKYNLMIGDSYLTSSLTTGDIDSAEAFTISSSGITTSGGSTIYISSDSGLTTSSGSVAYVLDRTYSEDTSNTMTSGTYFLGINHNGTDLYFDGTTTTSSGSLRLTLTSDLSKAVSVEIEYAEDAYQSNAYYISYNDNYIHFNGSTLAINSTKDAIYYDSSDGYWKDSTSSYLVSYNSGGDNEWFAAYTSTKNGSFTFFDAPAYSEYPAIKGIAIKATTTSVNAGEAIHMETSIYPSCLSFVSYEVNWTSSDENSATVSDGSVSGVSSSEGVTITASTGSVSDSITIVVEAADETLIGIYDFALSGNNSADTSATSNDNLKVMIQASWSGLGSDPLSSVSASNCFRGAGGTNDSYPVQESKAAIKMCSSKNQGTMTLTFGSGTGIKKVAITACGYDGNTANYTLSVGTSSSDTSSQQMKESAKDSSLLSVSDVSSYVWDFESASDSVYLEGNWNGSQNAYRILVFSIAIYNA